jgi:hypothetical protein
VQLNGRLGNKEKAAPCEGAAKGEMGHTIIF